MHDRPSAVLIASNRRLPNDRTQRASSPRAVIYAPEDSRFGTNLYNWIRFTGLHPALETLRPASSDPEQPG